MRRLCRIILIACLLCVPFLSQPVQAIQPDGGQTIAPALYVMFDMPPVNYQALHPERGPVGGVHFCMWEDINPSSGVFAWGTIDDWLALQRPMTVTLESGAVISKPVMIMVLPYISSTSYSSWPANTMFYDGTPNWVYTAIGGRPAVGTAGKLVGYVMTSGSLQAVVPMYDSSTWRDAYYAMVAALGAKYESDTQVAGVVIATGIDGETQATKSWGADWPSLLPGGVAYNFSPTFVQGAMSAFRTAFPTKTILINNAPVNGINHSTADYATTFTPTIGIKNSGMWADGDSETGYGTFTGMFDPPRWYSMTVPIWLEPKLPSNAETNYWMLLQGLSYHPDAYTLYPEFWSTLDNTTLRWFTQHLGKAITTTPSIWAVFRDYEYPYLTWGSGSSYAGVSGHMGDWEYWLYRVKTMPDGNAPRLYKSAMPVTARSSIYARQARRTDWASGQNYIYLRVADGITANPISVTVTYIDHGTDAWALEWKDITGTLQSSGVTKVGTDTWLKQTFYITDMDYDHVLGSGALGTTGTGADLRINCNADGDETVHMVEIAISAVTTGTNPSGVATPGPTPTRTPIPPTPTVTPLPAPTIIAPSVQITRTSNTYISQWYPTSAYNTAGSVIVRSGDVIAGLMRFDNITDTIPVTATIDSAVLNLRIIDHSNLAPLNLNVYTTTVPWVITSTWRSYATGLNWSKAGANGATDRGQTAVASRTLWAWNTWISLDVTNAVQAWVSDPTVNQGLVLKARGVVSVAYWFGSSIYPAYLTVTYH